MRYNETSGKVILQGLKGLIGNPKQITVLMLEQIGMKFKSISGTRVNFIHIITSSL